MRIRFLGWDIYLSKKKESSSGFIASSVPSVVGVNSILSWRSALAGKLIAICQFSLARSAWWQEVVVSLSQKGKG